MPAPWAYTLGKANQQAQLEEGWRLIQIEQPDADQLAQIQYVGRDVLTESLTEITARIAFPGDAFGGAPLVVFNTLPWDRTDVIQLSADVRGAIVDSDGDIEAMTAERKSQQTQPILDDKGNPARLVAVQAPAFGYHTYILRGGLPGQMDDNSLTAERQRLESAELRLTLDDNGEISSLYDKVAKRELVAPGQTLNQLVTYANLPWPTQLANIDKFDDRKSETIHSIADWQVTESGPIRAVIEITRRFSKNIVAQKIILWAHTRRIDFVTYVEWHTQQTLLWVLFPLNITNIENSHATYERKSDVIQLLPNHQVNPDRPGWINLSEGQQHAPINCAI